MDRISVSRLSFRRKGSSKKEKHHKEHQDGAGKDQEQPSLKYIRFAAVVVVVFGVVISLSN